jgi:hypothetical protein
MKTCWHVRVASGAELQVLGELAIEVEGNELIDNQAAVDAIELLLPKSGFPTRYNFNVIDRVKAPDREPDASTARQRIWLLPHFGETDS